MWVFWVEANFLEAKSKLARQLGTWRAPTAKLARAKSGFGARQLPHSSCLFAPRAPYTLHAFPLPFRHLIFSYSSDACKATQEGQGEEGDKNNLVATQQTFEHMYLHTARVRYHYRNCLEMGGPIVKKKGEAGRTEARDLRETLGYALCCVVNCSQPVAMDYLGVRAHQGRGRQGPS